MPLSGPNRMWAEGADCQKRVEFGGAFEPGGRKLRGGCKNTSSQAFREGFVQGYNEGYRRYVG